MICIFDIETNGFLFDLNKFHVGVTKTDDDGIKAWRNPAEMCEYMSRYKTIVGHNAVRYDVPALKMFVPDWKPDIVLDTLILSRLMYPDRTQHPAGGNALADWGTFFGMPKGDHTDFGRYSPEMEKYCIRDVEITSQLWDKLKFVAVSRSSMLEHSVAEIVNRQFLNGFGFDVQGAHDLMRTLVTASTQMQQDLQDAFPPREIPLKTKVKTIPFNPGSRDQIAYNLIKKYGWKPTEFTETGKPKIDESVLETMTYPEARLLEQYLLLEKRISQAAQWIESARGVKIHGDVNTNGAVSGRMTHSSPNMAQVPRCGSPYGKECRALFRPTRQSWVQVGADASGLELRMFAHYLAPYDNGEYGKIVCDGDIHTHNQKAAGLSSRDQAKTFIYGMLYGAGDAKIGPIVEGTATDGARLKASFRRQVPAYDKLLKAIEVRVYQANHLKGLDGRILPVRSSHSALNLLLQSAGAVVMKQALVNLYNNLEATYRNRYAFMANIHDEWQIECEPGIADDVGKMAVEAIRQAGIDLALNCPLKGEYKIGNNWSETH